MFEIPPPDGPPPVYVKPSVLKLTEPPFGRLRWSLEDHVWLGKLSATGATLHLRPKPETPEIFSKKWASWLPLVDRDPIWIADHVMPELRKLDGYGWPVFPFAPTLSMAVFDATTATLYLDMAALGQHVFEVRLNSKMKVVDISLAG